MPGKRIVFRVDDPQQFCALSILGTRQIDSSLLVTPSKFQDDGQQSGQRRLGEIYLGVVSQVDPRAGHVKVDIGSGRWAMLRAVQNSPNRLGRPFRKGEKIAVRVLRAPIDNKGPLVTQELELRGRFFRLLMNGKNQHHMNFFIRHKTKRDKAMLERTDVLKSWMQQRPLPAGYSLVGEKLALLQSEDDWQVDLNNLMKSAEEIESGTRDLARHDHPVLVRPVPANQQLVDWLVQQLFDCREIVVDDEEFASKTLSPLVQDLLPPLVEKIRIEEQLEDAELFDQSVEFEVLKLKRGEPIRPRLFSNRLDIPGGGYLTHNKTEALVAVNVHHPELFEEADQDVRQKQMVDTNLRAVPAIRRLLDGKGLSGIVVVSFLPMTAPREHDRIEKGMASEFKLYFKDAAREFRAHAGEVQMHSDNVVDPVMGIYAMTYQNTGELLLKEYGEPCMDCKGTGFEKFSLRRLRVPLNDGVSLNVNRVDRLTSIDVNASTLRARRDLANFEYVANRRAAQCIKKGLLRDREITGRVVIDFIDMPKEEHKAEIEKIMADALELNPKPDADGYYSGADGVETTGRIDPIIGLYCLQRGAEQPPAPPKCSFCNGCGWLWDPKGTISDPDRIGELQGSEAGNGLLRS
ncbi:MAG: ribonuclease E/G [Gammaproteobacteria bacterium AqS3]|nr:ribonuclease E/G [Gammaproteobacteria bacterium AqS3]